MSARRVLAGVLAELAPRFILVAHTSQGLDFGPALAGELEAGCITAVESLGFENGAPVFVRPRLRGQVLRPPRLERRDDPPHRPAGGLPAGGRTGGRPLRGGDDQRRVPRPARAHDGRRSRPGRRRRDRGSRGPGGRRPRAGRPRAPRPPLPAGRPVPEVGGGRLPDRLRPRLARIPPPGGRHRRHRRAQALPRLRHLRARSST